MISNLIVNITINFDYHTIFLMNFTASDESDNDDENNQHGEIF